jgi:hypothetical protein
MILSRTQAVAQSGALTGYHVETGTKSKEARQRPMQRRNLATICPTSDTTRTNRRLRRAAWEAAVLPLNYARKHRYLLRIYKVSRWLVSF